MNDLSSSVHRSERKTWCELNQHVKSFRRKFSNLSTKVPTNFTFREISPGCVRVYFLSVPNDKRETTMLYVDLPAEHGHLGDGNDAIGDHTEMSPDTPLPWMSLLESSFQMIHPVTQYSKEEQLQRERKRQVTWGITSYEVDNDSGKFIFPACGSLFSCADDSKAKAPYFPSQLKTSSVGAKLNCQICPSNANLVSYVCDNDVWAQNTATGSEIKLTFANKGLKNINEDFMSAGVPSYIIQEEFDRYVGHWWQPFQESGINENIYRILYEEVDDSDVDILHFPQPSEDGTIEEFRFPRAGTCNSKSSLKLVQFIVSDNGQIEYVCHYSLRESISTLYPWAEYLVRAGWTPDGKFVWAILLDRPQTFLQLVVFPLSAFVPSDNFVDITYDHIFVTPTSEVLLEEKSNVWLNIHDILHFFPVTVPDEISYLWASEESGYRQLYLVTSQLGSHRNVDYGSELNLNKENKFSGPRIKNKVALTCGEWEVFNRSVWVDESRKLVYFVGFRDTPLEKHLYVVSIDDPCNVRRLTEPGFSHTVHVDVKHQMFVSVLSNTSTMPRCQVYKLKHSDNEAPYNVQKILVKNYATVMKSAEIGIKNQTLAPEIFNHQISSGHLLYGMVFKPPNMVPGKKYPVVLVVYGGPEVQLVSNDFKGLRQLRQLMLASQGYVVISIDSRGSKHRGIQFEANIKNRMGTVEIADQVEMLEWLAYHTNYIDLARVAIHGWSYGGYLSLMGLAQRQDFFKVAVAGAPVTSWTLYDTGYTERYMGLPSENTHSYSSGSVLSYVLQFPDEENRLLIIHGLLDENVHFAHTSQLVDALIKAGKPHQLQVYPNERHSLRHLEASEHFETTLLSFFNQWL